VSARLRDDIVARHGSRYGDRTIAVQLDRVGEPP
jgi:hypothetical protein